jgi:hypothetical protein
MSGKPGADVVTRHLTDVLAPNAVGTGAHPASSMLPMLTAEVSRFIDRSASPSMAAPSDRPAKFTFADFWRFTEGLDGGLTANCLFMTEDLHVGTAMGLRFRGKADREAGLAMATALGWIFKLGHPNALRVCDAADIARDYNTVLGMEALGRQGPGHLNEWRAATNCRLTADSLERTVRHKLVGILGDLRIRRTGDRYLGEFDSFPAGAQLCIVSMAWADGPGFGSPAFCRACRDADWFEAARQCRLNSTGAAAAKRQQAQAELMRNAAYVKLRAAGPAHFLTGRQ